MIYQQPESVNDNAFTATDLLNIENDFPESPYVYFGNSQHTVICVVSSFDPAAQWCSGKAPDWSPPFTGFPAPHFITSPPPELHTGQDVPPPDPWQPPAITPEPAHTVFLLAAIFLSLVIRALK